MATRYSIAVLREEYDEATGKVLARAEYRIEHQDVLQEAWDAAAEEVSKFGWFDDR
jgi:hypothetical protein